MAPKHAMSGPHAHYRPISAVAPEHTTDGPQRSEYSKGSNTFAQRGNAHGAVPSRNTGP